jgi:hypothetical protein
MSEAPIHDNLSSEFDASRSWWRQQGALEELKLTLTFLRSIKKPTKQTEEIIQILQKRLDEFGRK